MSLIKAIVVVDATTAAVQEVPLPQVQDDWVLVKVEAIALNPTDWKHVAWGATDVGCRVGCDFAGTVVELGSKVSHFTKGDRIAGWIHGSNRANQESGAFAEYAIAKARPQRKIPNNMTFVEAASLGVAIMTVCLGMYKDLKLPLPTQPAKEPFPLLIHGGSTATGMAGIQFAKLSGLTVITTCSPHNFDLVRSFGADVVFDYKSPTCAAEIKETTRNQLVYAWDCIGDGAVLCGEAMSDIEQGNYGSIMPGDLDLLKATNPSVTGHDFIRGYDSMGEKYLWLGKEPVEPDQEVMEYYISFQESIQPLLQAGLIKPSKVALNKTGAGLYGALQGLEEMQAGRVSGEKLVYTLESSAE